MSNNLLHPKYRPDIDGLRAIAVLSVVGFHAFPSLIKGGFIGVDIFFVISGFLISTIIFENLERNQFSFIEFYSRRIRRIFPALLAVMFVSLLLGWFLLLPDEYKQLGKHIAGGASFVSNFILWSESGYFDTRADSKLLLHLWSLGIEEQFYVIFPLLVWATWKRKFNFLVLVFFLALVSFGLNIEKIKSDPVASFYSPQTRFWELMVGALVAYAQLHECTYFSNFTSKLNYYFGRLTHAFHMGSNDAILSNIVSILGLASITLGFILITRNHAFPGYWAILPTIGAAFLISGGSQAWVNRRVLSNQFLVFIGLISFPLYLWHWILLGYGRIINDGLPSREIRLAIVVLSILLAWGTYRYLEKPLRNSGNDRAKTSVLVSLMLIAGFTGYVAFQKEGLPFRLPKKIQELTTFKYDHLSDWRPKSCFLAPDQTFEDFAACKDKYDKRKDSILLWGDSHAAHLYPGFVEIYSDYYNIVQRTMSNCAPISRYRRRCSSWLQSS